MPDTTKTETAPGGTVTSNFLLGFGLYMPFGSVQIVAIDDDDKETWEGVPMDSILIDKTICKIRMSQYPTIIDALRKSGA